MERQRSGKCTFERDNEDGKLKKIKVEREVKG